MELRPELGVHCSNAICHSNVMKRVIIYDRTILRLTIVYNYVFNSFNFKLAYKNVETFVIYMVRVT